MERRLGERTGGAGHGWDPQRARDWELETEATRLLREQPRDPEYPHLLPHQERWRRRRERVLPPDADYPAPAPNEIPRLDEAYRVLANAGLTGEEQACFLLFETHLWSYEDIGRLFGFSGRTAWNRVNGARRKVSSALSAR